MLRINIDTEQVEVKVSGGIGEVLAQLAAFGSVELIPEGTEEKEESA